MQNILSSSIGNDVVDLNHPKQINKHLDQRFIARVFNPDEIHAILHAQHANQLLWEIWSAKEAIFKAFQTLNHDFKFRPKNWTFTKATLQQLTQHDIEHMDGMACVDGLNIALHWQSKTQQYTHCTALLSPDQMDWTSVKTHISRIDYPNTHPQLDKLQSNAVRQCMIELLPISPEKKAKCQVIRPMIDQQGHLRPGPPVIKCGDQIIQDFDISLSHDGPYVAAVLLQL